MDSVKQITENREWLTKLLTPAQVRALACQRGIDKWKTKPVVSLIEDLAKILDIQEPRRVYDESSS
jgi:hypothetical protein